MPIPLAQLNPQWLGNLRKDSGEGVTFDCPVCPRGSHRLAAYFANPRDGGRAMPMPQLWRREGEDFPALTLEPSIDYAGHWHGWVEDGQVIDISESPARARTRDGEIVALSPRQFRELQAAKRK